MDFTALELGLRNCQLLQVKCFLRIQIETFRYYLKQNLLPPISDDGQINDNSNGNEQQISVALEKFFHHDWQNIYNKIISFATIKIGGDYSSKILAILLYRSLIYSCNQLMLIISTIPVDSGDPSDVQNNDQNDDFVFNIPEKSLLSASSLSLPRLNDDHQTNQSQQQQPVQSIRLIKRKILQLLLKQINYLRNCLDNHIDSSTISFDTGQISRNSKINEEITSDKSSISTIKMETIEQILQRFGNAYRFQELFEYLLKSESISLFPCVVKRYSLKKQLNNTKLIEWPCITERIVDYVAKKIISHNDLIDSSFIGAEINRYLRQTGRSIFQILLSLFRQTSHATLRQRLLHIFAICLDHEDKNTDDNIRIITNGPNFPEFRQSFPKYFHLTTIIDLYLYCMRTRIHSFDDNDRDDDDTKLELSLEWFINGDNDGNGDDDHQDSKSNRITKSMLLPILSLNNGKQLIFDWEDFISNQFNHELYDHYRQSIFLHENFSSYLNSFVIWKYFIDNMNIEQLTRWIESDQLSIIDQNYTDQQSITMIDLNISIQMFKYLLQNSSKLLKIEIINSLIANPYFFNQHELNDIIMAHIPFETLLKLIGKTNLLMISRSSSTSLNSIGGCLVLEKLLNKMIKLSELIKYLIEENQFEYLYLLYNQYKIDFNYYLNNSNHEFNELMIQILKFMHDLCRVNDSNLYEKSLLVQKFLNDHHSIGPNDLDEAVLAENQPSITDDISFLFKSYSDQKISLDFLLLMITLAKSFNFNDFNQILRQMNLLKTYQQKLQANYPILSNMGYNSSNNVNIYSFLQQTIPFIDFNQLFKHHRRKRSIDLNNDGDNDKSINDDYDDLPNFSQQTLSNSHGFKSELNLLFYLKNYRLIDGYRLSFTDTDDLNSNHGKYRLKNVKKLLKKSSILCYNNLADSTLITTCLLYQKLLITDHRQSTTTTSSNQKRERQNFEHELRKFYLHLTLGQLIDENIDELIIDNVNNGNVDDDQQQQQQQQRQMLSQLLRRSHFSSDRYCSQKLLDLASLALERKYSSKNQWKIRKSMKLRIKLLSSINMVKDDDDHPNDPNVMLMELFEWRLLLIFAQQYSLKLSYEPFLSKCIENDNWLLFIMFIQLYDISKDSVHEILLKYKFNNQCIGEHLLKAFQNSRNVLVKNSDSNNPNQQQQQQQQQQKLLQQQSTNANKRNLLYSKLFKNKPVVKSKKIPESSSTSPPTSSTITVTSDNDHQSSTTIKLSTSTSTTLESDSLENLSQSSIINMMMTTTNTTNKSNQQVIRVLFESRLQLPTVPKDLLQLLIECYGNCQRYSQYHRHQSSTSMMAPFSIEKSFQVTLLYASVSLSNPILSLIACSINTNYFAEDKQHEDMVDGQYSKSLKYQSFACWLLASVSYKSKQMFIDWYTHSNGQLEPSSSTTLETSKQSSMIECYLKWTPAKLLKLFDILTSSSTVENRENFRKIRLGFEIFQIQVPAIQILLEYFIEFLLEKNYHHQHQDGDDQQNDLLKRFQQQLLLLQQPDTNNDGNIEDIDDNNEWSSIHRSFWIKKCSLILINNSLIISKPFELNILLSNYNFIRIQDLFIDDNYDLNDSNQSNEPQSLIIPDYRLIYLFNQCINRLSSRRFRLPIEQLLSINSLSSNNNDSNVDNRIEYFKILKQLIIELQQQNHYDCAKNLINLLNLSNLQNLTNENLQEFNEFIVNEWILKLNSINNDNNHDDQDALINNGNQNNMDDPLMINTNLEYWEHCWSQLISSNGHNNHNGYNGDDNMKMKSILCLLELFLQKIPAKQFVIKCFIQLKCLYSIESILNHETTDDGHGNDMIDDHQEQYDSHSPNDSIQSSNISLNDDPRSTLISKYHEYELRLVNTLLDGETFMINHVNRDGDGDGNGNGNGNNEDISDIDLKRMNSIQTSWKTIWKYLINYYQNFEKITGDNGRSLIDSVNSINDDKPSMIIIDSNDENRSKASKLIIKNLLDNFCLKKAKFYSRIFNYHFDDFKLIDYCLKLVADHDNNTGHSTDDSVMDASNLLEITGTGNVDRIFDSIEESSFNGKSDQEQLKIVNIMKQLKHQTSIGANYMDYIVLMYKISCLLNIKFNELIEMNLNDSYQLLKLLLSTNFDESNDDHPNDQLSISTDMNDLSVGTTMMMTNDNKNFRIEKYLNIINLAKEFIQIIISKINDDDPSKQNDRILSLLTQFVFDDVESLVQRQFEDIFNDSDGSSSPQQQLQSIEIELDRLQLEYNSLRFSLLLRLLREPYQLGHRLLDRMKKLKFSFDNQMNNLNNNATTDNIDDNNGRNELKLIIEKRKYYIQLVELYIRVHESFTVQCDVNGIALVLYKIRMFIMKQLYPQQLFHLILRLMTGIGRYSEMTYCFDLFRQSEQFELILSKRVQRTPQLRIALLNYLKNAENIDDLLPLVAIRFFLYREMADQHRNRAEKLLSTINFNVVASNNKAQSSMQHPPPTIRQSKQSSSTSLSEMVMNFNMNILSSSPLSSSFGNSGNTGNSTSNQQQQQPSPQSSSSVPPKLTITSSTITSIEMIRKQLETIMYEYQEAEMNYVKSSSYSNADYCSTRAQLLALQLYYFDENIRKFQLLLQQQHQQQQSSLIQDSYAQSTSTTTATTITISIIINLDSQQFRDFINQCSNYYEALIISKAYASHYTVEWADAFFINAIINNNIKYAMDLIENNSEIISFVFLEKIIKRFELFSKLFRQQQQSTAATATKSVSNINNNQQTQSPLLSLSPTFVSSLSQIRTEIELQKIYSIFEQLMELILCNNDHINDNSNDNTTGNVRIPNEILKSIKLNIDLYDRYRLAMRMKSKKILNRLLNNGDDNASYLMDKLAFHQSFGKATTTNMINS